MPPSSRVLPFLLVFAALFLFALIATVASEFSDVKWIEAVIRIGEGLGRLTFVAIAITFILVEGIPMLAAWYKKQRVKEAREEGRVEGREEGRAEGRMEGRVEGRQEGRAEGFVEAWEMWQEWQDDVDAWEQRKAAAESEGRDFTEPRPAPPRAKR